MLSPLAVNVYRGVTGSHEIFRPAAEDNRVKITSALCVPAMLNFMVQVPNFEDLTDPLVLDYDGAAPSQLPNNINDGHKYSVSPGLD